MFSSIDFAQNTDDKNLYFTFLRTNPEREQLSEEKAIELQAAHIKNIEKLHSEGKLVAAGPFDGGGGIFIMKSESIDTSIADYMTDPAIKANRFLVDIHPIKIHKGKICPVGEKYKMVTYKFVEFTPAETLDDCCIKEFHSLLENFGMKDSTIASYYFEDTNGGILILNTRDEKVISYELDNAEFITHKKMNYTIRNIWIAKETFCEN